MKENTRGGIGVVGLLGVAFVVLKLCGVIHWSWWWVTCPFWIGLPIIVVIFLVAVVWVLAEHFISKMRKPSNRF
jgi:hypothetical protein